MQILTPGVKPQGSANADIERIKLCDADFVDPTIINAEFYRHFVYDAAGTAIVSTFDTDLAGAPYTLLGQAVECKEEVGEMYDVETCYVCDNLGDGTKPAEVKKISKYLKSDGMLASTEYETLDGQPYAPVGVIERCPPKKPTELVAGGEALVIDDTAAVGLTLPPNAQYAIIQNLTDGPIWFYKDGTNIGLADGTEGFRLDSCGTIKLGCDPQSGGSVDELANFSAIAGTGYTGRLQICYFACS